MTSHKFTGLITLCTMLLAGSITSWAQVKVLTFEGLADYAEVGNYYHGGTGGGYGITFLPGSLSLISDTAGGEGNFENAPSGSTIVFFTNGNSAIMNVDEGFTTGFSFYYAAFSVGTVTVYAEPNAGGSVLGTFELPQTVFAGRASSWQPIGVTFEGTAFSVSFGGAAGSIGFDDITIGSASAGVPEPSTYALGLGAVTLLAAAISRRRGRS
ncbi:MAG: hypothetical protein NDI75_05345 [Candidatus Didemnitutus sp.]|nr:hypothetical protein [Candidatus Didemnitutus sp.]